MLPVVVSRLVSRPHRLLLATETGAGIELEQDDVAVFDNVGLALLPILAGRLDGQLGAVLLVVVELHDLGHDEALLEVGVDATGGLWRLRADLYGPALDLVLAGREEVGQLKSLVTLHDDLLHLTRRTALLQVRFALVVARHLLELELVGRAERDHHGARVILVHPLLDLGQPLVLALDILHNNTRRMKCIQLNESLNKELLLLLFLVLLTSDSLMLSK